MMRQIILFAGLFVWFSHEAYAAEVALPLCATNDKRVHVDMWTPLVGKGGKLQSDPPVGDGKIVYIELGDDDSRLGCSKREGKGLYSFERANQVASEAPGLLVNLRGNVQAANGVCYFSGFFMNERVFGIHQGWTETAYIAVDKFEVIKSGNFCLTKR